MFFMSRKIREEAEEKKRQDEQAFAEFYDTVWEAANTIHLYAALSEEETRDPSLKKKQEEICRIAENLLELSGKRGESQK